MKRILFSIVLVSSISFGFSQEKVNNRNANPTEINGRLTEAEKNELQAKKDLLTALDKKEAWLKSDPKELAIAKESGWFKNAEKTRLEVRKRIKELENK